MREELPELEGEHLRLTVWTLHRANGGRQRENLGERIACRNRQDDRRACRPRESYSEFPGKGVSVFDVPSTWMKALFVAPELVLLLIVPRPMLRV